MKLFYIRHGDPVYDPDSLTPLGARQAEAVAKRLAMHGIDEIYSSPSVRAMQTATPLSELLKKPVTTLDWCNEALVWEEFTVTTENGGKNWMFWDKKIEKKFQEKSVRLSDDKWYEDPFFDPKVGEGVRRVNREVDTFLAGYGYVHDRERGIYTVEEENNKRIAIFAHQGFSMAFFSSVLDIPYPLFSTRFDIAHSCVSLLDFSGEKGREITPKVRQYSNDSHIYKEGLPTKYNNYFYV